MKIGEILGKVVGGSAASIVTSVGDVVDKFTLSGEEKAEIKQKIEEEVNRHNEAVLNAGNDLEKAYILDVSNSRETNTRIQESEKASWLAKNIGYILDIIFVAAFFVGLLMIMFKTVPTENKELFYTGFGLLGGYVSTIINWHRGSSHSSKANGDIIRGMLKK